MFQFLRAFTLLAVLATASFAQVPEGGAYKDEVVQMDATVLQLFSNNEVQLNLRRAAGRMGFVVKKVTRSQDVLSEATYTFHMGRPFTLHEPYYRPLTFTVETATDRASYELIVRSVGALEQSDTEQ